MKRIKSLSAVFPCFNDGTSLTTLIPKVISVMKTYTDDYEVIVVNDASEDNSAAVLRNLKKKYPSLIVIFHAKNQGYGGALISGFKAASKEWLFYTDGDGQYDPTELPLLLEKVTASIDVVNGYKLSRTDPFIRIVLGGIYNFALQKIFRLPIRDIDCDFRLIKNSYLKKIKLTKTSGAICLELILKLQSAGATFREVGVHHYKRSYGNSAFFNIFNLRKTLADNIALYFELKK